MYTISKWPMSISRRSLSAFLTAALILMSIMALTACGRKDTPKLDCPFTDIYWDSTVENVISAEGENFSTYDSVYGGLCYTYPKEFDGYTGTIKYMFNEKNELMSVAWAYNAKDTDELAALYDMISTSLNELYGESGYSANGVGNYGNVWYLESGDIILSTMVTTENIALQYAYLHPKVSNTEKSNGKES